MRYAAVLGLGLGLTTAGPIMTTSTAEAMVAPTAASFTSAAAPVSKIGYYCSPGFEATYGGRCVATASTDEVELFLNDSGYDDAPRRVYRHHRRRHGLSERY